MRGIREVRRVCRDLEEAIIAIVILIALVIGAADFVKEKLRHLWPNAEVTQPTK